MTKTLFLTLAVSALLLTSCGLSQADVQSTVGVAVTDAVSTVNAQYTQIALLTPSVTNTPLATSTPAITNTPAATATTSTGATGGGVTSSGCDALQFVADVTVSDNEEIAAGTSFVKTWSIKNTGTCDWTTAYQLIFTDGDQMDGPSSTPLSASVPVGATTNISVSLVAPDTAGTYTGWWALTNASGQFVTGGGLSVIIKVP